MSESQFSQNRDAGDLLRYSVECLCVFFWPVPFCTLPCQCSYVSARMSVLVWVPGRLLDLAWTARKTVSCHKIVCAGISVIALTWLAALSCFSTALSSFSLMCLARHPCFHKVTRISSATHTTPVRPSNASFSRFWNISRLWDQMAIWPNDINQMG